MKRILRRTGYLLIAAAVVASNLVFSRAAIVHADAVRQIPTRIDAASTPADITITSLINRVVGTGDFNGDGADDFLVEYNKGGGLTPAFALDKFGIIFGKLNQNQPIKIDLETDSPDLSLTTEVKGAMGASQIATVGDLNDDGIEDIVVSQRTVGRIEYTPDLVLKVFFGSSSLSSGTIDLDSLRPDLRINIAKQPYFFLRVAGAADMNGDGVRDLVLIQNSNYILFAVPILFGPFAAGETIDLATRKPDVVIKTDNEGFNVPDPYLGDVNGDSITDVLIRRPTIPGGVPPTSELAVVFGSENLKSRPEIVLSDQQPDAILNGGVGPFAIVAGDINGDGADDVLVGTAGTVYEPVPLPWSPGGVSVTLGSPSLRGRVSQYDSYIGGPSKPSPFKWVFGVNLGGRLGTSVAVGDIDGDGVTDMIIGAPGLTGGENGILEPLSRVHMVLGSREFQTRVHAEIGRDQQDITISFGRGPEAFGLGNRVGSGDFNGDGFGDILVGNSGVAYVFFGGPVRAPEITKAKYRKSASELLITGTDLTGAARVEINGVLIDREVTFDPAEGQIVLQGLPAELNLKTGKNKVVVVRKGTRSNKIKVKL